MQRNDSRPHVKAGPVKYTKGFRSRMLATKLVNVLIILSIVILAGLSIFVYYKQPVKTEAGYVVAKPTYEFIEHGEKVLIVNDDNYNMFTPLKRFVTNQDVYLAEVIAGPYGEIEQSKGKQRVSDGENVIGVNLENQHDFLDMEYVVRKIDKNGEAITDEFDEVVVNKNVLGSVSIEQR